MGARGVLVFAVPLLLLALATLIGSSGWSTGLYLAIVLALSVLVVETLREALQYRIERDDLHEQAERYRAQSIRYLKRLGLQRRRLEELEVSKAPVLEAKRQLELLAFIGDTTPTLIELSRAGTNALDGWLGLVSDRVEHATGAAHAGVMVLRETLELEGSAFVARYEVMHRGGSRSCTLSAGVRVRVYESLKEDLAREADAESVYLAEFALSQERHWICLLLSTSAQHSMLETLCRVLVSPVVASMVPHLPPDVEGGSDLASARRIERLTTRKQT
jgi:hypothetical protein